MPELTRSQPVLDRAGSQDTRNVMAGTMTLDAEWGFLKTPHANRTGHGQVVLGRFVRAAQDAGVAPASGDAVEAQFLFSNSESVAVQEVLSGQCDEATHTLSEHDEASAKAMVAESSCASHGALPDAPSPRGAD